MATTPANLLVLFSYFAYMSFFDVVSPCLISQWEIFTILRKDYYLRPLSIFIHHGSPDPLIHLWCAVAC